ncbi:MAG: PAS domain S-box protein [Caldilineaceae bacterium]|nr:PAS domain S-box protein [Caldilineaceae bacterium]MBP8109740.1 PAS domain S-box protein [Caldilineaceae bacterium]MBP8121402.1 PAS domain S-box protein [Caldilineaceae bacterium]MBP9072704.1 PAS domain S-box protein [Caldilineaceae bacterium]
MKRWIALAVLFGFGLTCLVLTDREYRSQVHIENSRLLTQASAEFQNNMETAVTLRLPAVRDLRAFMLVPATLPDEDLFNRYAATVLTSYPTIRALQYVDPDHIIRYVYPLATNEPAVGLDLMSLPEVVPFVEKAIQERRMTVSDPILTVQGSLAIVARDPLFKKTDFLGMVQGVFDIDALLQEALGTADPRFAVQVVDAMGRRFWGVEDLLGDTNMIVVPVGDNIWSVTVGWLTHEPQPAPFVFGLIWIGGGLLLLSLLFITDRIWTQTVRLQSAVAKRTDALAKSEEKFRKIFYTSSDSITVNRLEDGVYMAANGGFSQATGYSEAEVVGRTAPEFGIWADPKAREQFRARLQRDGEVRNLEAQFRKADGSLADGLISASLIDLDGAPHIISVVRDITERKQTEGQLRYQANLIETVSDAIISTDMTFGIRSWNKAAERIYGWSAAEAIGQPVAAVLPTVYPDDNGAEVLQTFRSVGFWKGDVIQQNKEGTPRNILSSVSLIRDREGNPTGSVAVNRDITERKRLEDLARESEANFKSLIDNRADHIWSFDNDYRFLFFNKTYARMYLTSHKVAIEKGMEATAHLTAEEYEFWTSTCQPVFGGKNVAFEFSHTLEGHLRHFLTSLNPIYTGDTVTGISAISTDITILKEAEAALQEQQRFTNAVAETFPAIIYVYDMESQRNVYANSGVERLLGYSSVEIQTMGADLFPRLVHPDDLAQVMDFQAKVAAARDDEILTLDYRMRHKNGAWQTHLSYERPFRRNPDRTVKEKIGIALDTTERKQAETEVRQRVEELAALNALGRDVGQTLALDEVIAAGIQGMLKATGPDLAIFFLWDGETLQLKGSGSADVAALLGDEPEGCAGKALCGLALAQKKALYVPDIFDDGRCDFERCQQAGIHSFAALPLFSGGEAIGVIGLATKTQRDFEAQAGLLETLTSTIAVSLGNALLYTETQKRLGDLTTVHRAAQQLQVVQPPQALAQTLIRLLETELGYDYSAILLVEEESDALVPFALSDQGQDREFIQQDMAYVRSKGVRVGKGITGWVAQSGESIRLGDVREDPRYTSMRSHIRSEFCVPLRAGDQIIGVVNTETPTPNAYSETDQRVLETIAAQIVVAIQNARLLEQIQQYAAGLEARVVERTDQLQQLLRRQSALATIELAISQQYELQSVLDQITRLATDLLPATGGASIAIWDADTESYSLRSTTVPGQQLDATRPRLRKSEGATRWIIDHQAPLIVSDIQDDPFGANPMLREYALRAYAGVPLLANQKAVGVIYALDKDPRVYSTADMDFLSALAARAATAIDRVRLFDDLRAANQELTRTGAQLQEANKELETFSYSVSHDLRAPLRAISGFSEIIARRHQADLNAEAQHYLGNIIQASARMGQLIDDLLTYSRLGRAGVRREPVSLADLMHEISTNMGSLVSESRGTLKITQNLPTVMGDQTLLNQIFTNLVENALKYHQPDAPPQIVIDLHGDDTDDLYALISVTDNGIGVPPEYGDKIFNIFQRLHSEEAYPGTGIGLATVKKAVDLLGGQVWVESQVGKGSTFWVKLPKE